jgi:hypothetical protein
MAAASRVSGWVVRSGNLRGINLGTDAAPLAQIAGNNGSSSTGKMQADNQHSEERDQTQAVFNQRGARIGEDGLDVREHLQLHFCYCFVLILETICKELFKNICEQSRNSCAEVGPAADGGLSAEDGFHVILGLGKGRDAAILLHRARSGVIGGKGQPP